MALHIEYGGDRTDKRGTVVGGLDLCVEARHAAVGVHFARAQQIRRAFGGGRP
jgi:hypothetical protein